MSEEENNNEGPSPLEIEPGVNLKATTAALRTGLAKYKKKGNVWGEGHARKIPALAKLIHDGAPMAEILALRNNIKKSVKLSKSAEKRLAKNAPTRRLSAKDLKKATKNEIARLNDLLAKGKSSAEAASIIKKERATGKLAATAKAKATIAAKAKTESQERQESAEAKLKALKEARLVKAKAEREAKKEAKTAKRNNKINTDLESCIAKCQEKHGAKVGKIEAKAAVVAEKTAAKAAAVAEAVERSPQEKVLNGLLEKLEADGVDVSKLDHDKLMRYGVVGKWVKLRREGMTGKKNIEDYTDIDGYYRKKVLPAFKSKKTNGGGLSRKNRSNRKNRSRKNRCY